MCNQRQRETKKKIEEGQVDALADPDSTNIASSSSQVGGGGNVSAADPTYGDHFDIWLCEDCIRFWTKRRSPLVNAYVATQDIATTLEINVGHVHEKKGDTCGGTHWINESQNSWGAWEFYHWGSGWCLIENETWIYIGSNVSPTR